MFNYKNLVLFVFICLLYSFTLVSANNKQILEGVKLYIDPGHGGVDPGAIYKDLKESEINLSISMLIKNELEKNGAKVYLTRNEDIDLSESNTKNKKKSDLTKRINLINNSDCDLFISIHLNSDTSPTWHGAQTFYTKNNKENERLAFEIQKVFKEQTNTKREVKNIKNMYLFDRIKKPGVLIELGFISNPNERNLLTTKEYQQKLAEVIVQGIINYKNN